MADHRQRQNRVQVDDLVFDVREWGASDGEPLLALHGFPQCAASWDGLGRRLAEAGIRTIAFDQRGYSAGARPPLDTYTLEAVVADALGVADGLGLGRFHLCGFGNGAMQSWELAASAPDRVRSLTALRFPHPRAFALAVAADAEQRAQWTALEEMNPPVLAARALLADDGCGLREFLHGSGMPPEEVERTASRVGEEDVLAAALAWHLIPLERMAEVDKTLVPTLYIWTDGPALTRDTAARCGDHVAGEFRTLTLPGIGHWMLETAADRLAGPITTHVRATGSSMETS
ncbi:alpha/beta fold hydrolase [Streptomyces sp. NPDC003442]